MSGSQRYKSDTSSVLSLVQHDRLLPAADVVLDPVHEVVGVLARVRHVLAASDAHVHVPPDIHKQLSALSMVISAGFDSDGHKLWWPPTITMTATTMMAINYDGHQQ